jgi:integrase
MDDHAYELAPISFDRGRAAPLELLVAFEAFVRADGGLHASSTLKKYAATIRRFVKLGIETVDDVTKPNMARFQDYMRGRGRSNKTTNTEVDCLVVLLRWLERRGQFEQSRIDEIKRLRLKLPPARAPTFYTRQEFDRLCAGADRIGPWMRLALETCTLAGLRRGEMRRVLWEDVDLEKRVLRVRRHENVTYELGSDVKCARERTIPLCADLWHALKEAKKKGATEGPVFPSLHGRGGRFVSCEALKSGMRELSRWCGVPGVGWQKCRRTFVTWSLMARIPVTTVARWVGHSGIVVLFKHYAGWIQDYDDNIEALTKRRGS